MENKLYGFSRKLTNCLNKHQFVLVLVLSLFHVGLSYIHNLDSGRADPSLSIQLSRQISSIST